MPSHDPESSALRFDEDFTPEQAQANIDGLRTAATVVAIIPLSMVVLYLAFRLLRPWRTGSWFSRSPAGD